MGRKPNTELRRQQIIDALRQEMASIGFERASTRSIAEKAGLAPGLVHYHFKSKQEILLALVDNLIEDAERRFQGALQEGSTPAGRLAMFITTRVGLGPTADADQVKAWVGIFSEAMGQSKVRTRVAKWLRQDHERLAFMFEEAGVAEPGERAAALLSMILGSFSLFTLNVSGIPKGYAEKQAQLWLQATLG
jgi:TetR/AcrR family transcriptional repressor of bet genes